MKFLLGILVALCAIFACQCYFAGNTGSIGPISCTRAHEHYECGSACQTECATLGEVCPIVNIRCNDACYCDTGYARNARGACIPVSRCPPK